jgi:uncharacterized protein (DUF305 family)
MLLAAAGCRTVPAATRVPASPSPPDSPAPLVQPGAPGQPTHAIDVAHATDLSRVSFTLADVQFMQGMIGHHAQAVEMVELLKTRTRRADMKMLGLRIEVSQVDEIRMMQHWLEARGQAVPDEHAHHQHDAALMPGMLTPEAMARLAAASGPSFDRLFLEGMMSHHEGALVMVRDLFASPGAGQDTEIFAFASDVEADQKMEIDRMGAMLKELPQ